MSKIYFGYTTSTFGLKGELKCFTDFERKDLVLKKNHPIYIKDQKHILSSIRAHKGCFLIRIDNHEDINEVEEFRHQKIFIEREELELKNGEFLFQDIIGFSICEEGKILGEEERVNVLDAIKAVTINAAYQYFEENTKGSIKEGKIADLIILDKNPLKVDLQELKNIKVLQTIKSGEII